MNRDDANALAVRYHNVWRGGPSIDELRTQFADMDYAKVRGVLNLLARTIETPPSIRRIFDEYQGAHRHQIRDVLPDYSDTVPPPWITAGITREQWLATVRHPSTR